MALAVCPPGPRSHCVHDGDTVWLQGEKIRIADIDTPEIEGRCPYERQLALHARNRLVDLLNSGTLTLRRQGHDRYGRTLAVVLVDGRSAGLMLVGEGLARKWTGRRVPWC
ncbi:thermonuclease family protein [Qipengyuania citrea]|uniref:thermonuclease family protein n=1 Tax=Qipengyuania citrea TaxID=225971 RepID=UPI001D17A3A5|nr:thermonuclease family protein [Qipengyuania citrea]